MLDFLNRFKPFKRAAQHDNRRGRINFFRNFDAAKINRLNADWSSSFQSLNASLHNGLSTIRQRSRLLTLNNDYAAKFINMVKQNVVGADGMRLSVHALQPNGTLDEEDSKICTQGFNNWSKIGNCDTTGRLSFKDILELVITHVARDGEALIHKVRGRGKWGFQLQLIDPARLDEKYNMDFANGIKVRMGVETDSWGTVLAYHLIEQNINDPIGRGGYNNQKRLRIDAKDMLHLFVANSAEQLRGYPWMHTAMARMAMLGGYEDAAVTGARVAASAMGFLQSPDGAAALADSDDEVGAPEIVMDPGTFPVLPAGYSVQGWSPNAPNADYGDFVKSCVRGIASGLNVAYNSLANDLENVNISSIRSGTLEEREAWKAIQSW
jgi:lambda family phage portal protein